MSQRRNIPVLPPGPVPSRTPPFAHWWLISAFWLLIALASVLGAALFHYTDAGTASRMAVMQWLPWMVLSPVIVWLAAAFTLERSSWLRNIWVHLAACALIVGGLGTLSFFEGPWLFPHGEGRFFGPGGPPPPQGGPPHGEGRPFPPDGGRPGPDSRRPPGPFHGPPAAFVILRLSMFQLPTYWAVMGIAHALCFYRRAKERERREAELEARLTQSRLQALSMQLNPHFLFNTLNSIASLVYDQPRAADEMIGALSDLLRLTLAAPERQEIALREELGFLDKYLLIQEARFAGRLEVAKSIEPAALDVFVPMLVLQPIVENAIKHGIEACLAPGVIAIDARRMGETLHLRVTDNGHAPAGSPAGGLKEGVGLTNTRARLRELYGDRGTVQFGHRAGGGFEVAIQIPWRAVPALEPAGTPALA